MTNTGDDDEMDVHVGELTSHQGRLGGLVDRVATARDAAQTTLTPDAFGVFGEGLASECIQSQREGADALQVALDASRDHHQKAGAWANDLEKHELDVVEMFKVVGGDDGR